MRIADDSAPFTRGGVSGTNAAKPHFHGKRTNKRAIFRFCIEKGLLQPGRIAQTTFYRFIREHNLLANDDKDKKQRLAFSMKYANQLWQADTMFGPYLDSGGGSRKQTKLIAFIDDASRVRDQFLIKNLDLSSLEALNRQFTHWVENDYNAVEHDALGS